MSRNDELIDAFASVLTAKRHELRLSQEELAYKAKVNRTYIAKLEGRKNQPTLCVLHALATALNIDLSKMIEDVFTHIQNKKSGPRKKPASPPNAKIVARLKLMQERHPIQRSGE